MARIVIDCRWLGLGGAGRITEHLLTEVGTRSMDHSWVLWGRTERLDDLAFDRSTVARAKCDPREWFGQREILSVPAGDVVVYLHQIRPLRGGKSITFIHDTIPIRYGGSRLARIAKHAFLRTAARLSDCVITVSQFSRRRIADDLHVELDRIHVVRPPVDLDRAHRIASLRDEQGQSDTVLYVGRFDEHKNLRGLCDAFAQTRFAEQGGRLALVGGWEGETQRLLAHVEDKGYRGIAVLPTCSESELDGLLATSRALVQPSLEEGYGLPAFEAAAAGLPVAASRTGAMTELPPDTAVLFDPQRTEEIRDAIDDVVRRPARPATALGKSNLGDVVVASIEAALRNA